MTRNPVRVTGVIHMPAKTINITLTEELADLLAKVRREGEWYRSDDDVLISGLHEVAERDKRDRAAQTSALTCHALFCSWVSDFSNEEAFRAWCVAGSAERAEALLVARLPERLRRGIITTTLRHDFIEEFFGENVTDFLPKRYRDHFRTLDPTKWHYYQELHHEWPPTEMRP